MFDDSDINQMEKYLARVESGRTEEYFSGLFRQDPDWPDVFPLFQRLIDYGVTDLQQAAMDKNFRELKGRSVNAETLFVEVHRCMGLFRWLLQTYKASHPA